MSPIVPVIAGLMGLALVDAGALTSPSAQTNDEPPPMIDQMHARPSLVADTLAYQPGKAFTLGVTFEIDDQWHIYWDGANDSGFAPTIDLKAPKGWVVGEWRWPAPIRHETAPGQILDFIYEHRVTIFAEVTPPAEAAGPASFGAGLDWLVCQEACIPGDAVVTLVVPEGTPAPSAAAKLFEEARSQLPKPMDQDAIESFNWSWSRGVLRITPLQRVSMTFAPSAESPSLVDRFRGTRSKPGETLAIALGRAEPGARLQGVLQLFDSRKQSLAIYYLDVPLGELPSPAESSPTPDPELPSR